MLSLTALVAAACLSAAAQSYPAAPAASTAAATATPAPWPAGPAFRLVPPEALPRLVESFPSKKGLAKAARRSLEYLKAQPTRPFSFGDRQYATGALIATLEELLALIDKNLAPEAFEQAVRDGFDVFVSSGLDGSGRVVFSSYYQPVLPASPKKTEKYPYPLYKRPPDMVEVDPAAFDKRLPPGEAAWIGRVGKDGKLQPYFSRDDIDSHKALAGKGLELAWLKTKFDVLDIHIQGSGILRFPDGTEKLAGFAGTNAKPYNSVGLSLIKAGTLAKEEVNHERLRRYFKEHPEAQDWALAQNPRYTFFRLSALQEDGEPLGSIERPLVPARSIAIDPAFIPLGALAFFEAPAPQADKEGRLLAHLPTSRFALCMDTGGAIKGPGRVDIYAGHGEQAATTARNTWSDGRLYVLIKKLPPRER